MRKKQQGTKLDADSLKRLKKIKQELHDAYQNKEWYTIRSLLGNT